MVNKSNGIIKFENSISIVTKIVKKKIQNFKSNNNIQILVTYK